MIYDNILIFTYLGFKPWGDKILNIGKSISSKFNNRSKFVSRIIIDLLD